MRSFELNLWECRAMHGEDDVAEVVQRVARAGLRPGLGDWTTEGEHPEPVPFENLRQLVAERRWVTPAGEQAVKGRRPGPSEALEVWRFGVVRPEQPQIFCNLHISQRSEQRWDIGLLVATSTHTKAGLSLDEFCASWATLLDTLGDELYERTRPALGTFTNTRAEIVGFAAAIARRRLIIGWRTWFGPAYTDLFGREWLLGIPDTASPLDDGGVAHRLAGSARRLAEADRSLYSAVWPYLERASIQSHWPRPSRPRTRLPQEAETDHSNAAHLERDDVELTALRRDLPTYSPQPSCWPAINV